MAYTAEQLRNIRLAQKVGARVGATRKEQKAAIEAMLVESNAKNLNYGDRDSVGILQQRPSQGWKHAANPAAALQDFYANARQHRGKGLPAGQLAQAVQRSAFPDRYGQRADEAKALLKGQKVRTVQTGRAGPQVQVPQVDTTGERKSLLLSYLARRDDPGSLLHLASGLKQLEQASTPTVTGTQAQASSVTSYGKPGKKASGTLRELFYDPGVSVDNGQRTGAIGGHSDHVHVAVDNDADRKLVLRLAKRAGVRVTSEGGGTHTQGSFHYQKTKRGKSRAIDFGGDPAAMLAFDKAVARRFRPKK